MKCSLLIFCLLFFAIDGLQSNENRQKEIADLINKSNAGFTARLYPQLKGYVGSKDKVDVKEEMTTRQILNEDLGSFKKVKNFDVSEKWPECKDVIEDVQAQYNCSSSYAISVTSSIRDRQCILNGQKEPISAYDLLSCCIDCQIERGNGCNGGTHFDAFKYFTKEGVVSGGGFQSQQGCKPYELDPDSKRPLTTKCQPKCQQDYKKNSYESDKHYIQGQVTYSRDSKGVMQQLIDHGPVVARFRMYEDFLLYSKGIYQHKLGQLLGYHYVKIVGWGESNNGQKYWNVANSFGRDWGLDGHAKVARGQDECGIESDLIAGVVSGFKRTTPKHKTTTTTKLPKHTTTTKLPEHGNITCKSITGYYIGTLRDPTISQYTFNAQFQFNLNVDVDSRKVKLTMQHWNQTYAGGSFDFAIQDETEFMSCNSTNPESSVPLGDYRKFLRVLGTKTLAPRWPTIVRFDDFVGVFKLTNAINQCTSELPIKDPGNGWVLDRSSFNGCLCCNGYQPHQSIGCPVNPWTNNA